MKIHVYNTITGAFENLEFNCTQVKEILNAIYHRLGEAAFTSIVQNPYFYVAKYKDQDAVQPFYPVTSDLSVENIEEIYLIPELEGAFGLETVAGILTTLGATATATSTITFVAAAVINITLSLALNAIMSLVIGTDNIRGDVATSRRRESNLFGGIPLVSSEGVLVPIVFGNPFLGADVPVGVLISSSITTAQVR